MTYKNGGLDQVIPYIGLENLVLETDAPYLLPRTIQPKPKSRRNEPAYLPVIAQMVARLTNRTMDELATLTQQNSRRLFGLHPCYGIRRRCKFHMG